MDVEEIAHYRVVRRLGSGGTAAVYLAEDTRLHRRVALKITDASLASRASREAKAAAALTHPNVAQVFDAGTHGDVCYIAMEYVEGETLEERIGRGPISVPDIVDLARQLADGLAEAHGRGLIHRDIKPSNIMITPRGLAKILDFGLVKSAPQLDSSDVTATSPGVIVGTLPYMSPEQALGRDLDPRTDIFSLGSVLYEMITRRRAFGGPNSPEILQKIVNSSPDPMARFNYELPVELERIVRKCIEKEPGRRYQSARELEVDLRNLQRDSAGRAAFRWPRRGRTIALVATLVLIAAIGTVWIRSRMKTTAFAPSSLLFDNGCRDFSNDVEWQFAWPRVPNASAYHLQAGSKKMPHPAIDIATLREPEYQHRRRAYIIDENREGWFWRVRANVGGAWGPWSAPHPFDIEPLDTDCR